MEFYLKSDIRSITVSSGEVMTTFLLIRHGDSTAADRIPGRLTGIHLSERGRGQAEALAELLAEINIRRIFHSPLDRTRETAQIIAERLKVPLEPCAEFLEVEFGDWTNQTFSHLETIEKWKLFHTYRIGTRIPNGELAVEVQTRFVSELERLREHFPDEIIAVVSHGDPIKSAIAYYAGIPLDFIMRFSISTASVSVLVLNYWGPDIVCINNTADVRLQSQ